MTRLTKATLAACLALPVLLAPIAGAFAADETCLRVRDIKTMHPENAKTMTVTTDRGRAYLVTFANQCPAYQPLTHFVYEPWTLGQCLNAHDALQTNDKGPCFVESVKPL